MIVFVDFKFSCAALNLHFTSASSCYFSSHLGIGCPPEEKNSLVTQSPLRAISVCDRSLMEKPTQSQG